MPGKDHQPLAFDRERTLQNPDLAEVECDLQLFAVELALLGRIDAARQLMSIWYRTAADRKDRRADCLFWAWKLSGEWPEGEDEASRQHAHFDRLRRQYEEDWPGNLPKEIPHEYTEPVLAQLLTMPAQHKRFADATSGWHAMLKGKRLVKALDISLQLTESPSSDSQDPVPIHLADLDERSARIVKDIAQRWGANQQLTYLASAERLWPYYRDGMLATALNLNNVELQRKDEEIVAAFRTRMAHPTATNPLARLTLKELLELANENTLHSEGAKRYWKELDEEDDVPPLFKNPAATAEVAALEKRLGVTLPADYKEFLGITNGFGTLDEEGDGQGIFNGISTDCYLFNTENVAWIKEKYFDLPVHLLDISYDIRMLVPIKPENQNSWDSPLPFFDRVLRIGAVDINSLWLVQPELVTKAKAVYLEMLEKANAKQKLALTRKIEAFAGSIEAFKSLEWCCMCWEAGGCAAMTGYPSFRAYLESVTLDSGRDLSDA